MEDFINMNVRNEIKAQIIRTGMTMQEVVDLLADEYGWSDSVSNLSAKLQRESIRYKEVVELDLRNTRDRRSAALKLTTSAPRRNTQAIPTLTHPVHT